MKKTRFAFALLLAITTNNVTIAQNLVETYSKECGQTFAATVEPRSNNFRYVHALDIKDPKTWRQMTGVERQAYKFYRSRKLHNLSPEGERVRIGLAQYKDKITDELRGYRVDFLFGQSQAQRIRMYYVINNERNLLLRILIDPPLKQHYWVCEGFAAVAKPGDAHLYSLAHQAGPYFDYPATDYHYNINEVFNPRQLPANVIRVGEAYRKTQSTRHPNTRIEWANQQHIFTIDGKAVGFIIGFNSYSRDSMLDGGGGTFLYLNHAGKIVAQRAWHN